jgi:hypothetical protein
MMECAFLSGFYSNHRIFIDLWVWNIFNNENINFIFIINCDVLVILLFIFYTKFKFYISRSERKLINLFSIINFYKGYESFVIKLIIFFYLEGIYLNIFNKFLTLIMLIIGGLLCVFY